MSGYFADASGTEKDDARGENPNDERLMKFKIRAQWFGPDGRQMGVADDTAEGYSACDVIDDALPGSWRDGEFTSATITITKIDDQQSTDNS